MSAASYTPQTYHPQSVPPPPRYGTYPATYQRSYGPQATQNPLPQQFPSYSQYPSFNQVAPPPVQLTPAKQVDVSAIDDSTASQAMRQFISTILSVSGFTGSQQSALERLEMETVAFVERLYKETHEYANLSNRPTPAVPDAVRVCTSSNLTAKDLRRMLHKYSKKRKRANSVALTEPRPRSPSPNLLPSDEETTIPHIPPTLRYLPPHFPPLPPRHTYLRTPVASTSKKALPSLEKKLANAALVQESLKSLILATEDSHGPEDADLVGHVVNWENAASARKRWRWQ